MPRLPSFLARRIGGKAIPWLTYYEVARQIVGRGHSAWSALTPAERRELQRVVTGFRGRPGSVPERDRREVRRIVIKAVKAAARRRP
jgi:hypothetical protein